MSIGDKLQALGITHLGEPKREPLWKGPESSDKLGGITFSMLSRFLVCRERFRAWYIEGLRPIDGFNHKIEYGHMWHYCEETYAKQGVGSKGWAVILHGYCQELCKKYPLSKPDILKWYNVCKLQFEVYLAKWYKRESDEGYKVVEQEQTFSIPYTLPSGRIVYLRGKRDKVLIDKDNYVWLQENKTKGDIDEQAIETQLTFDLQTMMYIIAMQLSTKDTAIKSKLWVIGENDWPLGGVIYNVVRRPLSGGRHSVVRHKPTAKNVNGESETSFYERLKGLIVGEPEFFFMRWDCFITQEDIDRFKQKCLNPILEQLCWWYDYTVTKNPEHNYSTLPCYALHWQHPFGIYNPVDNNETADLDRYLETEDTTGLRRVDTLFEELQ